MWATLMKKRNEFTMVRYDPSLHREQYERCIRHKQGDDDGEEEGKVVLPTTGASSFVTTNGQEISWRTGYIETEKAHILVSSQGECSQAIMKAGGEEMRHALNFVNPRIGDIVVTAGFALDCNHVIHTSCSRWQGGTGETVLRMIVQKCLQEGEELGGTSIAFPVIATKNLSFPRNDASRIMLEETISFCQANPLSILNDIRFVVFQQDQALINAFGQEMANLQSKHKFRPGSTMSSPFRSLQFQSRRSIPADRVRVEVLKKHLCSEQTDAIVNIIGKDLRMGNAGKVSEAVKKASGNDVQVELDRLGPQACGSAVITSGGNLAARYIIHLITDSSNKQHLQQCVEECLRLAESRGIQSISLPAIGTGAYGMSATDSASLIFQALSNFSANFNTIRKVRIVTFQAQMLQVFQLEQQKHPLLSYQRVAQLRITKDTEIPFPEHWAPMPRPDMIVHTVELAPGSPEYQSVIQKVEVTARNLQIKKIERVQNPHLYGCYMARKQKMERDIGGNVERWLFHGTETKNVEAINTQGFDRSFCGVNGYAFGHGVYFARDASYAASYARPSDMGFWQWTLFGTFGGGARCMYLARVLVGKYCQGDFTMVVPPPKNPFEKEILYESVVDNPGNPSKFVVFYDNQCYPEYVITFFSRFP